MPDLNLMAIFARVVEAGSFAEAARRMATADDLTASPTSRQWRTKMRDCLLTQVRHELRRSQL